MQAEAIEIDMKALISFQNTKTTSGIARGKHKEKKCEIKGKKKKTRGATQDE
jgi:hypothetical protein